MPITVNIPDVGKVHFPDDMSEAEIVDAIKTKILPQSEKPTEADKKEEQTLSENIASYQEEKKQRDLAKPRSLIETIGAGFSPFGVPVRPEEAAGIKVEVPRVTGEEAASATGGVMGPKSAAVMNALTSPAAEFVGSPAGLGTIAAAEIAPVLGTVASLLWGAKSLSELGETERNAATKIVTGTPTEKAEGWLEAVTAPLMSGAMLTPGIKPSANALTPKAIRLAEELKAEIKKAKLPEEKPGLKPEVKVDEVQPVPQQPQASETGPVNVQTVQPEVSPQPSEFPRGTLTTGVDVEQLLGEIQSLPLRERQKVVGEILSEVPRQKDEGVEKGTPTTGESSAQDELSELRSFLSTSGENREKALRVLREREVGDASPGLQQTTSSKVAMPEVSSESSQVVPPPPKPPETPPQPNPDFVEPGSPVSNMFAAIDRDREAAGKPPMAPGPTRTWSDDEKIALGRMNQDPNWIPDLIEDVTANPRPLTSWEHTGMVFQKAKWKADFNEANRLFNEARDANRPEDAARALVDRARAEDNIVAMDKAVGRGGTGSEAGRTLAAQKIGLTDDLDLVSMRAERRALREDGKLTPEDEKEIDALHKEYQEKLAKVKASEEAAKKSEQEALGKLAMKELEEKSRPEPTPPHIQKIVDQLRKTIKEKANESRAYFKGKMLSLSPEDLYHLTRIAADNFMDIGADFVKWSAKMVADLGEWVKPHLQALFQAAEHSVNKDVDAVAKPADSAKIKGIAKKATKDLATQAAEAEDKIKAKVEANKTNEITPLVKKLAEHFYSQGIRQLEPMITALQGVLKQYIPEIDRLQTLDALSGRGHFTLPNPDVIKKGVRELSAEARVAGHIEQLLKGDKKLPKTGPQRDKPTANYRQLQQKLNELMKKLGVTTGDPATQLASALQAAKTYTRNRIADLKQEIATRERIVKTKTELQPDAELTALRKELEQLRTEHEAVFGKRQVTDEQRIASANKMLDRQIASLESDLEKGVLNRPKAPSKTPETPELLAKKSWLQALREYRQELRDAADHVEEKKRQKQLDAVDKKIDETIRKINEGDLSTKPKSSPAATDAEMAAKKGELADLQKVLQKLRSVEKAKTPSEIEAGKIAKTQARVDELVRQINEGDIAQKSKSPSTASPARQALQGELSDLQKVKRQLQNAAKPKPSPEEIKLQAIKTHIATQTAEYNQRLASGDYETRPKRTPVPLDEEAIKAKADLERLKQKWQEGNRKLEASRRPTWQKALDKFVSIERAFKLSSPVVFGKLTAAAFTRFVTTLTEEAVGVPISKAFPELAARAPREGGINVQAMAKGLTEALTKGMKDAYDTLTKGETDVEAAVGNKPKRDKDWMNLIGQVHGMIKAPVKRAEFTLSLEKRMAHAIKNGVDVTNPAVQTRLLGEALDDGYRSIFMQDNFAARKFNNLANMMTLDKKAPVLGKVSSATLRFLLPIVRVPMNIVSETAQGIYGVPVGSVKLIQAMRNGIKDLPAEQADAIMRNLKKGSIGAALMALGYLSPENVGGYDWREKRQEGDVKTGGFKVFDVNMPRWLTHAPWFELMQFGATIRHVKDQSVKSTGDSKGIDEGLWAAGFGLLEQTPFYGEMLRAGRASEGTTLRNQFLGELLKGTLEPAALQKIAEWSDEDVKRKPKTLTEHLEMGIPGLRQNVPEKVEKRR